MTFKVRKLAGCMPTASYVLHLYGGMWLRIFIVLPKTAPIIPQATATLPDTSVSENQNEILERSK